MGESGITATKERTNEVKKFKHTIRQINCIGPWDANEETRSNHHHLPNPASHLQGKGLKKYVSDHHSPTIKKSQIPWYVLPSVLEVAGVGSVTDGSGSGATRGVDAAVATVVKDGGGGTGERVSE